MARPLKKGKTIRQHQPPLPTPQQETTPFLRPRWLTFAKGVYVVLFAIVSWIAALVIFYPRFSVRAMSSSDPLRPQQVQFELSNDATFSMHDVSCKTVIDSVVGGNLFIGNISMTNPSPISEIEAGSKPRTFGIPLLSDVPQSSAMPNDFVVSIIDVHFTYCFRDYERLRIFSLRRRRDLSWGEWIEEPSNGMKFPTNAAEQRYLSDEVIRKSRSSRK